MPQPSLLGVDLGGTKVEAIVARPRGEGDELEVLARVRAPTERDLGYDHVLARVADVIAHVTRDAGLATPPPIGVGMPGSVTFRTADGARSDVALVKNSNTTCLNGRPFRGDLEAKVGAPIAFANDANCFALAEATLGAGRGHEVVFGVILGTGVGGGLVVRGRAWDGAQGIAGEWGHVPLEPERGSPCYCGKRGCIETYLSGPAIEARHRARTGVPRPLIEIAREEDDASRETIAELVTWFGRGLAVVIDVVDPSLVVLGGGVSNVRALYDRGVAEVSRWIFAGLGAASATPELATPIVKNTLGDSAGVFGAALLPRTLT